MTSKYWNVIIIALGIISELMYWGMYNIKEMDVNIHYYFILFYSVFIIYLISIYIIKNIKEDQYIVFVFFSLAYSFTLLDMKPVLSDDIYRYLWEGKVQIFGYNPFRYQPDSPVFIFLHDIYYSKMNAKNLPAIYPPGSQLLFFLMAKISYSLVFFKFCFILFFMGTTFLICKLLTFYSLNKKYVLIFCWNPLVIMETAGSGHLDIVGVFLLLCSLLLLARKKNGWAMIFLALSTSVKLLPIIFMPYFLKKIDKHYLYYLFIYITTIILLYIPYWDAGDKLFYSLAVYTKEWSFNSILSFVYNRLVYNRYLYLITSGIIVLSIWYIEWKRLDFLEKTIFALLASIIILSPVLFPWYLIWIVPFLVFNRNMPFIIFTGLVNISYAIIPGWVLYRKWTENTYILVVEYFIFYMFLMWFYRKKIHDFYDKTYHCIKKRFA